MEFRLAVEDMEKNHWVAWVLDLPGCFSSAKTQEAAITLAPTRISQHFNWLRNHGSTSTRMSRELVKSTVVETFQSFVSDGMYVVNAFFEDDRRPLSEEEVEEGIWLLNATRQDLLDLIHYIPPEKLTKAVPGEMQGTITGILEHVAWVEWWYLDRLNLAFDRDEMPADPVEKLKISRAHTYKVLPSLVDAVEEVERSAELWSPRKLLRRTLWHERDHTQHIEKIMTYI